ncbi:unnamed protein product [Rhizophagus irregularis]|uniref:Uncharacterized protein n=1 Tax=Rhizophagus irregularis TaxID=588596 RepID=A0A916EJ93_9GLOM|nr:unnamed protein product [Rhizophagus irregularis]
MASAQNTQQIESINKHVHNKVNYFTSLYNLLISINDHINNDKHLKKFEVERNNVLLTINLPMLNTRFFDQVDIIIKEFLTPIMLRKQKEQMNQSVCYDINQITEWHHLIKVETDDEEIGVGIREQEQDARQILFQSLVLNLLTETIFEHFFQVGTYSRIATFHISIIPSRWYLNTDVELNDLLQQYPFIPICDKTQLEDDTPFQS